MPSATELRRTTDPEVKFRKLSFSCPHMHPETFRAISRARSIQYLLATKADTGVAEANGIIYLKYPKPLRSIRKMIPGCNWEAWFDWDARVAEIKTGGFQIEKGTSPTLLYVRSATWYHEHSTALKAAREGRFEDIPPAIMLKYGPLFTLERKEALEARDEALEARCLTKGGDSLA